ncbi:MAG: hypothetical protein HY079_12330 [Elusimicrobia bacterium]|nr:hypothetical protein [Elusimicrobiota bacterium]
MRLVYDDLVRDYLDSLHSKLRNFAVEPEFLATWVHDEDDAVSLSELFAAAQSAGARELAVVVGAKTAAALDRARLEGLLKPFGAPRIEGAADGSWTVTVSLAAHAASGCVAPSVAAGRARAGFVEKPAASVRRSGELHPAYRAAVERLAAAPRFEGAAPPAPAGGLVVEAADGAAVLSVAVGADGLVAAARHRGAAGTLRGLLDGLCSFLPGRSFQEGRDHAVIRLESSLRDRSQPSPARGVVTPKTADPAFDAPQRMVRAAYGEWARKTGAKPGWNFWDDQPSAAWLALSPAERLARAKAAVAEGLRAVGAPEAGVEILEILNDCRIVLAATPETVKPDFAPKLLRLEGLVKAKLDPRIEVQLESLEDRNRRAERTARTDKLI